MTRSETKRKRPVVHDWPQRTFLEILLRGTVLLLLVGAVLLLALLEDPGMDPVGDLGDQGQVVPAEAGRVLPLLAVLVETADR